MTAQPAGYDPLATMTTKQFLALPPATRDRIRARLAWEADSADAAEAAETTAKLAAITRRRHRRATSAGPKPSTRPEVVRSLAELLASHLEVENADILAARRAALLDAADSLRGVDAMGSPVARDTTTPAADDLPAVDKEWHPLVEDATWLARTGVSWEAAIRRLGYTSSTSLAKALARCGRPDVAAALKANGVVDLLTSYEKAQKGAATHRARLAEATS